MAAATEWTSADTDTVLAWMGDDDSPSYSSVVSSPVAGQLGYNVASAEFAELVCLASDCRFCGQEVRNCVEWDSAFPCVDVTSPVGDFVDFPSPSVALLMFPFLTGQKLDECRQLLLEAVETRVRVGWTRECEAGLPKSSTRVTDAAWCGAGQCCLMVLVTPPEVFEGRWHDQAVALKLRRLLGLLDEQLLARVMTMTGSVDGQKPYCQFIPVSEFEMWYMERATVLDKCAWNQVFPTGVHEVM